jgi:hypothetical protein
VADIRIKIGAEHDRRSTDVAMSDMASSIRKANAAIANQGAQTQKALLATEKSSAKDRVRAETEAAREISAIQRRQEADGRRASNAIAKERLADIRRMQRAEEQAAHQSQRERERFAFRTSQRFTRFLFPRPEGMLGYGRRMGTDVLRGLGLDTSISGGIQRSVSLEKAGVGLAQQERIATGKTRGGAAWAGVARETGTTLSTDPEQIVELMRAFTGKTGNFDAIAKGVSELAPLALAAGGSMTDMGDAAGFLYLQLQDQPDAMNKTITALRGIAGQTAVGAVEWKDYGSQMGRVAAHAKFFKGDVTKNILQLSALTQLAMAGGATSAQDAARGITAFAQTTSKSKRVKAFKEAGIDIFEPGGREKRPIMDLIKDSMIKTKGKLVPFNTLWMDTLGQKPTRAMLQAFNKAGGGEKGWLAAKSLLAPYENAQMTKEVEAKNIADYQRTKEARVQQFQNNLDKVASSLADNVLPALEKLAPAALQVASGFANVITWATTNPGEAISAAIVLSIARAGLESAMRIAIDRALTPGAKGGVSGQSFGGAMGAVGIGASIGIPLATGIYLGGVERFDQKNKELSGMMRELSESSGPELKEKLLKAREMARGERGSTWGRATRNLGMGNKAELLGLEDTIARKESEYQDDPTGAKAKAFAGAQKTQTADDTGAAVVKALVGQTLQVEARVTNFPPQVPQAGGASGAGVDPGSRQPQPGAR